MDKTATSPETDLYIASRVKELEAQLSEAKQEKAKLTNALGAAIQRMEEMQDQIGFDLLTVQECLNLSKTAVKNVAAAEEDENMGKSKFLSSLLGRLPKQPRRLDAAGNPSFWSDGHMILCPTELDCEHTANFLEEIFRDSTINVTTGFYDPVEDRENDECDEYTGFYYIDFI